MAVRAYNITLANFSGKAITLAGQNLCHGEWSANQAPPARIEVGQTVTFRSESDGIMTGCEGFVKYECPDGSTDPSITPENLDGTPTELYLYFDNPYIGTTTAAAFVTTGDVAVNGGCSATTPSSSGSGFAPPPTVYRVAPSSGWSGGTLSDLYPLSSGAGASGEAYGQFASGAIPVVGPIIYLADLFGNAGNMPDAVNYFQLSLQPQFFGNPASIRKYMKDRGLDMSKGLRGLTMNPKKDPVTSVRKMMELV